MYFSNKAKTYTEASPVKKHKHSQLEPKTAKNRNPLLQSIDVGKTSIFD